MERGMEVGDYTTKALREWLAGEVAKPAHSYAPPQEGVLRLTGALLVGISRDMEALTAKVDAIYANLPENQPTNVQDMLHECGWCGGKMGINGYCKEMCRGAARQ